MQVRRNFLLSLVAFLILGFILRPSFAGYSIRFHPPNPHKALSDEERIIYILGELGDDFQREDGKAFAERLSKDFSCKVGKQKVPLRGRNEAESLVEDFFTRFDPPQKGPFLYIYHPTVEIQGKTGLVRCRLIISGIGGKRGRIWERADEEFTFVKENGKWKLSGLANLFSLLSWLGDPQGAYPTWLWKIPSKGHLQRGR